MLSRAFRGGEVTFSEESSFFKIFPENLPFYKDKERDLKDRSFVLCVEKTDNKTKFTPVCSSNNNWKENYQPYTHSLWFSKECFDQKDSTRLANLMFGNIMGSFLGVKYSHEEWNIDGIWWSKTSFRPTVFVYERKRDYINSFLPS